MSLKLFDKQEISDNIKQMMGQIQLLNNNLQQLQQYIDSLPMQQNINIQTNIHNSGTLNLDQEKTTISNETTVTQSNNKLNITWKTPSPPVKLNLQLKLPVPESLVIGSSTTSLSSLSKSVKSISSNSSSSSSLSGLSVSSVSCPEDTTSDIEEAELYEEEDDNLVMNDETQQKFMQLSKEMSWM